MPDSPPPEEIVAPPAFYTGGHPVWNLEKQPNLFPAAILARRDMNIAPHWRQAALSVIILPAALLLAGVFIILATNESLLYREAQDKIAQRQTRLAQTALESDPRKLSSQALARLASQAARPSVTPILASLARKLPADFRAVSLRADIHYTALQKDGTALTSLEIDSSLPARLTGTLTLSGILEPLKDDADFATAEQALAPLFRSHASAHQLTFQGVFAKTYSFATAEPDSIPTTSSANP